MEALKFQFKDSYIKILLYIVGIAALFYVATSRTVVDAILNFCFAGMVPGTDIIIDPQTMLMGQTVIVGLSIVTVLIVYLYRKISYRRIVAAGMAVIPVEPKGRKTKKSAVKQDYTLVYERPGNSISKARPQQKAPVVRAQKNSKSLPLLSLRSFLQNIAGFGTSLVYGLRTTVRKAAYLLQEAVIKVIVISWIMIDSIRAGSIACWTWIRPYAERFDTWLEVHYRMTSKVVSAFLMRYESVQVIVMMIRQGRQVFRQLFK